MSIRQTKMLGSNTKRENPKKFIWITYDYHLSNLSCFSDFADIAVSSRSEGNDLNDGGFQLRDERAAASQDVLTIRRKHV